MSSTRTISFVKLSKGNYIFVDHNFVFDFNQRFIKRCISLFMLNKWGVSNSFSFQKSIIWKRLLFN